MMRTAALDQKAIPCRDGPKRMSDCFSKQNGKRKTPLDSSGVFGDQALKPASAVRIPVHSLLLGKRRSFQIESVPFLTQSGVRER